MVRKNFWGWSRGRPQKRGYVDILNFSKMFIINNPTCISPLWCWLNFLMNRKLVFAPQKYHFRIRFKFFIQISFKWYENVARNYFWKYQFYQDQINFLMLYKLLIEKILKILSTRWKFSTNQAVSPHTSAIPKVCHSSLSGDLSSTTDRILVSDTPQRCLWWVPDSKNWYGFNFMAKKELELRGV